MSSAGLLRCLLPAYWLVEDSIEDVILFERALRKMAGGALWLKLARDGQDAVDYLVACLLGKAGFPKPQAIVSDLKMPRMDGFEFIQWVRTQPEWQKTKVIVLTSSSLETDRDRASSLGANAYLIKPSCPDELVPMIEQIKGLIEEEFACA